MFNDHFKQKYQEEEKYWDQITSFLPKLLSNEEFKQELDSFFKQKVEQITQEFEQYESDQLQCAVLTFVTELWSEHIEIINEAQSQMIINMLKFQSKSEQRAIKFVAVTQMFRLLELFTSLKRSEAPIIYKSLIFTLVDGHYDDTIRSFIMNHFTSFFETSESIPVGILLDPLMKQFMEAEGITYKYNTFDFEFFIS